MNHLIIICIFVSGVLGIQNFPVLHKQIGILLGDINAQIQIELIYDPICDNTADFDKKLLQVLNQLTEEQKQKIALRFIVFPLPFHMSAHKIVQGIIYVLEKKGSREALKFMRYFLDTKDQWNEIKVREQSIEYLTRRIAQRINEMFNLNLQKTVEALRFGSKADRKVREWSKLTIGVIKAAGTPRMSINRAPIEDAIFMATQQLRALINQMLRYTENHESIDQN